MNLNLTDVTLLAVADSPAVAAYLGDVLVWSINGSLALNFSSTNNSQYLALI